MIGPAPIRSPVRGHGTNGPVARVLLLAILLGCGAWGCGSIRTVDPQAGPVSLRDDEGLVLLHLETEVPLEAVYVSGVEVGGPLEPGTYMWLIAASPGRYVAFNRIDRRIQGVDWRYVWAGEGTIDRFGLQVQAGRINYPGLYKIGLVDQNRMMPHFVYGREYRLTRSRINRSAMVLPEIESRYGELLDRYPIRFAGMLPDRFFEALAEARSNASGGSDADGAARAP